MIRFRKCALLEAPRQCHYRMRMGDQENQWHSISQICRNRVSLSSYYISNLDLLFIKLFFYVLSQIIAVCDFLNYLRYIERGLVKSSGEFF